MAEIELVPPLVLKVLELPFHRLRINIDEVPDRHDSRVFWSGSLWQLVECAVMLLRLLLFIPSWNIARMRRLEVRRPLGPESEWLL